MESSLYKKIFKVSEILSAEKYFPYTEKIKLKVFVPGSHVEILLKEMSIAGAGLIGNYEMCSFRSEGTGTFLPKKKSKPFSGKLNELSFENEYKFEMECEKGKVNDVVNSLLKNHPYEETAYEIYSFQKRDIKQEGMIIELKADMDIAELIKRLNKNIKPADFEINSLFKSFFKKIIFTKPAAGVCLPESAKYTGSQWLLEISKNNYKLFKI